MQSRSERTLAKWKRRLKDLISTDNAKILVACIPELREILQVGAGVESEVQDIGLTSSETLSRLKSVIAKMFHTFPIKSKVGKARRKVLIYSRVLLPSTTYSGHR